MECFLESARTGSFSKAASVLYISQQTVSRQVKAMEDELGTALFFRSSKGIVLTDAGRLLYDEEKELIERHRQVISRVMDLGREEEHTLRIGIRFVGDTRYHKIIDTLLDFSLRYPQLNIEQETQDSQMMIDHLNEGRLDMIITYISEVQKNKRNPVIHLAGTEQEMGFVLPAKHVLAAKRQITLNDLKDEVFGILPKDKSPDFYDNITGWLERNSPDHPVRIREYPSWESLKLALATGKCVSILYRDVIDSYQDKIKFYPFPENDAASALCIICRDSSVYPWAKKLSDQFRRTHFPV